MVITLTGTVAERMQKLNKAVSALKTKQQSNQKLIVIWVLDIKTDLKFNEYVDSIEDINYRVINMRNRQSIRKDLQDMHFIKVFIKICERMAWRYIDKVANNFEYYNDNFMETSRLIIKKEKCIEGEKTVVIRRLNEKECGIYSYILYFLSYFSDLDKKNKKMIVDMKNYMNPYISDVGGGKCVEFLF